ncbi:MAG: hypothetical protein EBS41_03685 [Actinobacteria bacterium]|nr:hypothetical protein [Actinomycetota bacterium]
MLLRSAVHAVKVNVLSPPSAAAHYRRSARDRGFGVRQPSIPVQSLAKVEGLIAQCASCVVFGDPGSSKWLLDRDKRVLHLDRDMGRAFGVEHRLPPEHAKNLTVKVIDRGQRHEDENYCLAGTDAIDASTLVVIGGSRRRKVLAAVAALPVRPRAIIVVDGGRKKLKEACEAVGELGWKIEVVSGLSASASSTHASVAIITH